MKKLLLIPISILFFLMSSQALALNIVAIEASDTTAINNWILNLDGNVEVLEDFEGVTTDWYTGLTTSLGTFTAGGDPGIGATSYKQQVDANSDVQYFSIRDTAWYGRGNTTNTENASHYLDSGDITELTLDLDVEVFNLFFYLQDPSDVGATTDVQSDSVTYSFSSGQSNGSLWFMGISANELLSSISWTTTNQNDGYGLDDFSTVNPVPEPATMFLLGSGLIGIAGFRRKYTK